MRADSKESSDPSKGFVVSRKRIEALAYASATSFGTIWAPFSVKKGDRDGFFFCSLPQWLRRRGLLPRR